MYGSYEINTFICYAVGVIDFHLTLKTLKTLKNDAAVLTSDCDRDFGLC